MKEQWKKLLRNVAKENRTDKMKLQLRKIGSAFLTHHEVIAQEAVYRTLSMPMKQLSRTVVFVDTNPKSNRIGVLKDLNAISLLDDDDTNVLRNEKRGLQLVFHVSTLQSITQPLFN